MPIYQYICEICGKELELIQKINDPLPLCDHKSLEDPELHYLEPPSKMKKKIVKSNFQLKGSGWYKDGYSIKDKK